MGRLNGHDHLDASVSSAMPGTRDRIADLAEWYHLQKLIGGEDISPFHEPRQVDEATAWIARKTWRGAIRDVLRATDRQQHHERE